MSDPKTLASAGYGWIVWVNSDLTEGRGHQVIHAICATEATAMRLAQGANTQGSAGTLERVEIFCHNNRVYGPVILTHPSTDDRVVQQRLDERRAAEEKARSLGLTTAELELLRDPR